MATNITSCSLEAIAALTEAEKARLIIMLVCNKDRNNVDWDAATAIAGSKSKHSFQVTYYNTMKKLSNGADGGGSGGGSKAATPKRKRAAYSGEGTPTPTPKKRGKGHKAIKTEGEESEPVGVEAVETTTGKGVTLEETSFFDTDEDEI